MKLLMLKCAALIGSYFVLTLSLSSFSNATPTAATAAVIPNVSALIDVGNTDRPSATQPVSPAADIALSDKLHDRPAWAYAQKAFQCAKKFGLKKTKHIVVIDYSLPSTKKRFWVVDPNTGKVAHKEYVAHGVNTGQLYSKDFSNINMSKKSSIGVFYTAETYSGRHGYSLRLDGQELEVNDLARRRAIVIHGAKYVNSEFIKKFGMLGYSWGCPALDKKISTKVIKKIKGGTMVFSYYPDQKWLKSSDFLTCEG